MPPVADGDILVASQVYGDLNWVNSSLETWQRDLGVDLDDDLFWNNERPPLLNSFPNDKLSRRARSTVSQDYWPGKVPLWDSRLVATSVQHGIASDGAAGYFPLTFRDDLGITGTVNKLNGAVQEWALKEVDHLLHVADRCTTIDELENRMRDRQMQFSTRVLTRRAISESPKIRCVYDFSFPGNIVLAMFEKSFYSLLPDVHFMEHHANPLLAGPVRQAQFSSQGLVPFWFDISKMDKNVHFCVIRAFLDDQAAHMSAPPDVVRKHRLVNEWLLTRSRVVTPEGDVYSRAFRLMLSGALMTQSLESWCTSIAIMRAAYATEEQTGSNPCRCMGVLADDGLLGLVNDQYAVHTFFNNLHDSLELLGFQFKDNVVYQGTESNFVDLGYRVKRGVPQLSEDKLVASLLCRERFAHGESRRRAIQAARACSFSQLNRGIFPKFHRLCEELVALSKERYGEVNLSELHLGRVDSFSFKGTTEPGVLWSGELEAAAFGRSEEPAPLLDLSMKQTGHHSGPQVFLPKCVKV